jgi:chromosome segregation ATPase
VKREFADLQRVQAETETLLRTQREEFLSSQTKAEKDLGNQIQQLNDEIQNGLAKLGEREVVIEKLKKKLRSRTAAGLGQQLEFDTLSHGISVTSQANLEQLNTEKSNMQANYEATIARLTEECDGLRKELAALSSKLKSVEKLNVQLKQKIVEIRSEKEKLSEELAIKKEELERERKLSEASTRAAIVAAESDFAVKLEEAKRSLESDKRRIFTFAADQFHQFCNSQDTIDEEAFKTIMTKAREDLTTLTKSDLTIRRTIGAAPGQETSEAVARLRVNSS